MRLAFAIALWSFAVVPPGALALRHGIRAGERGIAPRAWPAESALPRRPGVPLVVMFADPRCACTRTSLGELARIVDDAPGASPDVVIALADARTAGPLEARARELDFAIVEAPGEHSRFGAQTSGHVVLYDGDGHLRFDGGVTFARDHAGESVAGLALAAALRSSSAPRAPADPPLFSVFGCSFAQSKEALR